MSTRYARSAIGPIVLALAVVFVIGCAALALVLLLSGCATVPTPAPPTLPALSCVAAETELSACYDLLEQARRERLLRPICRPPGGEQ